MVVCLYHPFAAGGFSTSKGKSVKGRRGAVVMYFIAPLWSCRLDYGAWPVVGLFSLVGRLKTMISANAVRALIFSLRIRDALLC